MASAAVLLANTDSQKLVSDILTLRIPKQSCETVAKSVLFIKTRPCIIFGEDYEVTPSVKFGTSPFDELRTRTTTVTLATDLIKFIAAERKQGYIDQMFNQLQPEIIYTSTNYINAFYNNNIIDSISGIELSIVAVHLACKTQSAFKRLEKVHLFANHFFKVRIPYNRDRFAEIEMDILQSLGFQLAIADDYPQKHIYQFIPKMSEKHTIFKERAREMKIVCSIALELATTLIMATPLMYNRDSSVIAVACIFIANKFKPIFDIPRWWTYLPELINTEESTIKDLADLIFDALRYAKTSWSQFEQFVEKKSPSLSSPLHSNPSASPSLSSFDGSITPPQKIPLDIYNQRKADCSADSDDHILNRFLSQKSYTYGTASTTPSACSSETNSLGSTGLGANKTQSVPSNFRRKSVAGTFNRPFNMMTPGKGSIVSPLVRSMKTSNIHSTERKSQIPEKPKNSDMKPNNPEQPSTGQTESTPIKKRKESLVLEKLKDKTIPTTQIFTPPRPSKRSLSTSAQSSTAVMPQHPLEKKFKNRLMALVNSKEVLNFYASSSGNYKLLDRAEKEVVKAHVKEMKNKKKRRHSDMGFVSTPLKRTAERSLDEKLEMFREEKMIKISEE